MMCLYIMRAMPWNLEEATMKLHEQDAQHDGLDSVGLEQVQGSGLANGLGLARSLLILLFFRKTFTITEWEVRKIRHDLIELLMRMVQPTMWLLIFGQVFAQVHVIQTGGNYIAFLATG